MLSVKETFYLDRFRLACLFIKERDPALTRPVIGEIKPKAEISKFKALMPKIWRIFVFFIRAKAPRDKRKPAKSDKIKISSLFNLSLGAF